MQKLQLTIPEPCHENWQQMTPTDQGRFCNACAKEVVDFSTMTDMQVLNYFSTLTHEKVCGRALPEQLNRTINRPTMQKKRLFWYWNYIVMFLMFFTKGNAAKAQGGIKPVTECSPLKANDIRGEIAAVSGIKRENSRVITGKVTDINGNPVAFASIKIKGTQTGISADANGVYSLRLNPNDVLIISGASFFTTEVLTAGESVINTVLQMGSTGGVIFIAKSDYSAPDKTKAVAILKVKDEETGNSLPGVSVVVTKNGSSDSVFTDKKGMYKLKGITTYDRCFIKIVADGYEGTEFTINEKDFKDRKKEWEILLRKQKVEDTRSKAIAKTGTETIIRMGAINVLPTHKEPLYVVDDIITPKGIDINPDDIEEINVLQGPAASAIFGPDGANGAIVINTKKLKIKNLDAVIITSYGTIKRQTQIDCSTSVMGAMVKGVTVRSTIRNTITDSLKIIATKINGAIKIYPNPTQRGNTLNIALKLKQAGLYQIQITDATGRIVLQKQVNAVSKEFTENIAADARWSSGVYYISLIDNKDQLINKTSFIFQ